MQFDLKDQVCKKNLHFQSLRTQSIFYFFTYVQDNVPIYRNTLPEKLKSTTTHVPLTTT